jgi:cell shape-determining protein MreC
MERMDTIDRILEQKNEQIKQLEEENKKLKKERDLYKARDEELNENCF